MSGGSPPSYSALANCLERVFVFSRKVLISVFWMILEVVKAAFDVTSMQRANFDDVSVLEVLVPSELNYDVQASTLRLAQALLPERQEAAKMPPVANARSIATGPATLLAIGADSVRAVLMLVLRRIQHAHKVAWRHRRYN